VVAAPGVAASRTEGPQAAVVAARAVLAEEAAAARAEAAAAAPVAAEAAAPGAAVSTRAAVAAEAPAEAAGARVGAACPARRLRAAAAPAEVPVEASAAASRPNHRAVRSIQVAVVYRSTVSFSFRWSSMGHATGSVVLAGGEFCS
jgi:hypothetical protein